MGYCNRFAFACPEGLIKKEELAPEVGLYWYRGKGKPFKIARHPVYRQVEIPVEFFQYIIMSKIQSDRYPFFGDKKEYFEEYIEEKKESKEIGRMLSYKVSCEISDMRRKIERFEREKEYTKDVEALQNKAIDILHKHGITWQRWDETWVDALEKYLNSGAKGNDLQLRKAIEHAEGTLNYLQMMKGSEADDNS
jgi:DNA topoisomerase VI subunit B